MRSLADGILKGMIQRKQQEQKDQIVQQQMKQVDQQIKLREQQMKMEERADQRAQALEEQKQNLINKINNYLGGEFGGGEISDVDLRTGQPAQQGMQGQQGDRLINMLTDPRLLLGGQVAGVNLAPIANTVLGKQRLEEQRRGTDIRQQTFERGASEGSYIETLENGERVQKWVPKYLQPGQQRPDLPAVPDVETYTRQGPGGEKIEGIRNKRTGQDVVEPKQIEPPKALPAETAGKVAMSVGAVDYGNQLKEMIINPKTGKINKKLILQAHAPMGGIGQGRLVKSLFRDAMDARIRASTGAAINAEEIPYYESVYFPHPLDEDDLIKDKFKRLDEFLRSYLETIDPQGIVRKRIKQGGTGQPKFLGWEE